MSIESELTCSICLEIYTDPLQLSCLHSYCRQCLKDFHAKTQQQQETLGAVGGTDSKLLKCPNCRKTTTSENGIDGLPINFTLGNIAAKFKESQQTATKPVVLCSLCEIDPKPAVKTCRDCSNTNYCVDCLQQCHPARGVFKKHVLCEPGDAGEKNTGPMNDGDVEDEKVVFCSTCSTVTSETSCQNHLNHTIQGLDKAVKNQQQGKGDAEESKESMSEKAGKKASSYQELSRDEYEESWKRPWWPKDKGKGDAEESKESMSKKAGKKASSYQELSRDEYEESWKRPWWPKDKKKKTPWSFTRRLSEKDTEYYRNGYPGKKDHQSQKLNIKFYTNKVRSRPDGDYIDIIHKDWFGDYHKLEVHQGYIQWLFPIRESGMNYHAQELQLHEAKTISGNRIAHKRVLTSYKMMLDFYGMKMKNETGELERAKNYNERFAYLNRSTDNYSRITRILKSLGELGYEYLKVPFVRFVLKEALEKKTLDKTVNSCYNYWMETIKDDKDREELKDYAHELLSSDEN